MHLPLQKHESPSIGKNKLLLTEKFLWKTYRFLWKVL